MANRTVKVTIEAAVTGAIANVKAFGGAVSGLGKELDVLGQKHQASYNKIASTTGKIGIGLALGFGLIVKSAMDFDKEMSAVGSVAEASSRQLEGLRQAALNAGRDTAYTATQAATAEEELAKAGVSTADILGGALKGSLSLAAAGSVDLATAATIAAQAMNEFQLKGTDVGHIADVLTAGANKSATDVAALGESLNQVGAIAHQTGMSLEDTTGTLAAFAQQGLVGEEAGTTLKQMLLKLEAPSGVAAAEMQRLGINIYDATGKFVGITGVAQQLTDALGKLDPAQRNAALGTIFGARAIRGATILYGEGAKGVQDWINAVNDSGAAQRAADERLNNLSGDLHKLLGSLQAVAISASGGANAGLRDLAQGAEKTVNAFLGLPKPVQETAVVLLGVSAAGLLATSGLMKARKAVVDTLDAMRQAGPLGSKFASGITTVGKVAAGLSVAAVGVGLVYEGMKAFGDWVDKKYAPVTRDLDKMTAALKEFAATGKVTGELAKTFGQDLSRLSKDITQATTEYAKVQASAAQAHRAAVSGGGRDVSGVVVNQGVTSSMKQAQSDVKALDASLAQLATSGGASQAYMAFVRISDSLRANGMSLAQINAIFPQYSQAAANAASQTTGFAQGTANAATQLSILDKGMTDAIAHGETFNTVWNELNGSMLNSDQAMLSANQAIENVTKTLKDNKNAWDGNSNSALQDRIAVGEAAKAAADAAQKKYEETGSVDAANGVYQSYIGQLRAAMLAAGMNKAAVDRLLATYAQMPASVTTSVNAPGLGAVNKGLWTMQQYVQWLRANNQIDTNVVTHYSTTGTVTKPGTGNSRGSGLASGGVLIPAASGLAYGAGSYPASNPPLIKFAEPQTRGETLIPNFGIPARRGLALADYAASHYGGRVSTGPTVLVLKTTGTGQSMDTMLLQWLTTSLRTGRVAMYDSANQPVRIAG